MSHTINPDSRGWSADKVTVPQAVFRFEILTAEGSPGCTGLRRSRPAAQARTLPSLLKISPLLLIRFSQKAAFVRVTLL